jgi:micrococcal nuclease
MAEIRSIRLLPVLLSLLLIFSSAIAGAASDELNEEPVSVRIVSIVDGDTLVIQGPRRESIRLRLIGIDAPEMAQPQGNRARERLLELALGQEGQLIRAGQDRYGRVLGILSVGGVDLAADLLRQGLAWYYRPCSARRFVASCENYRKAEEQARLHRVGLWADPQPRAPWDWRRDRGLLVPISIVVKDLNSVH